jgi:hypothetical protein
MKPKDEANYGEPVTIEELESHYKTHFLKPDQFTELVRACIDNEIKKSKSPVNDLSFFKTFMSIPKDFNNLDADSKSIYHSIADWFINTHNIHPIYGSNHSGWYWNITKTNGTTIKEQDDCNYFSTHFEALNKSIEEAFKIIEKQK